MRLLCQNIGTRANREDLEVGKFFQGRYRAVRILDEETLLACAAYVDLNLIRAAMAETIEESDFTSVQRRIQTVQQTIATKSSAGTIDSFLAPLTIDEKKDPIGPCPNQTRKRCSDKGFLSMSLGDYLELLDASARLVRADKSGSTPVDMAPIFERLKLDVGNWKLQIQEFGRLFSHMAGRPKDVYEMRSLISKRRFYLKRFKPEPAETA